VTVELLVFGEPMPKGSKTAVVRNGKATLLDARRGESRKRYELWKTAVAVEARYAMRHSGPLDGPLAIVATFSLRRPKHESRDERTRTWHTVRPDADKLLRAVLDPLSGVVIADDARIAHVVVAKRYAVGRPGVHITISQLKQGG
jgi:Holliday junction resolvase RusA-like endonuclease